MADEESLELFPGEARPARPAPAAAGAPLAERMRPRSLDEVQGQDHLVGHGAPLRSLVDAGELPSLILWGPPGVGKTTLARLLAAGPQIDFVPLSAVLAGVKDVRAAIDRARTAARAGRRTVLFIDELHRFNRAQQDALLPHVEAGTVTLVGATTENPSFEVVAPLLSRCRVYTLHAITNDALARLAQAAAADPERGLGKSGVVLSPEAAGTIASAADGDARRALGIVETAITLARRGGRTEVDDDDLREAAGQRALLYDRDREQHYNVISAFIKSLRASDPDAALYWMARMLEGGEDPLFVARRLVIFASEDVGNAEPHALPLATSTFLAVERIGLPEGRITLAQCATFLACAPKSNASMKAIGRATDAARHGGSLEVPMHLRNAPTRLLKELGYGEDYESPHAAPDAFVARRNLPEGLPDGPFYEPTSRGAEREIAERLAAWRKRQSES
ncbi:MAG: replication-associated recombination protein A [Myxococcales bacterium]|nr:replication-associated recombination protein A [Myxococcales bacterium]